MAQDSFDDMLDSFDHVVVLMLENRSLDNILGYLYADGVPADAPLGKTFEGVAGKKLSNPVPKTAKHQPPDGSGVVTVRPVESGNYFHPFPDPGENYPHVNTQLFNLIDGGQKKPYNLPPLPLPPPTLNGFVTDYIENFSTTEEKGCDPKYEQYREIMECYSLCDIPVITTLAREFGVFDHWFCAVPSQTWCNRAFWHADTSWGRVNNGPSFDWFAGSNHKTIFSQLGHDGNDALDWKIYVGDPLKFSLTWLIHFRNLLGASVLTDKFQPMDKFEKHCAAGKLPAYTFIEPRFLTPHNDMHPSSTKGEIDGCQNVGSVLLGERLVCQVYNAIRNSKGNPVTGDGNTSQNTLLIITFDEHGGCYDHVAPTPVKVKAPVVKHPQDGFDFTRLGLRVPMIMVSAHIAPNTIVKTPMHHGSFLKTVQKKWSKVAPGRFPSLSPREAPLFTEVFTSQTPRPVSEWPPPKMPALPPDFDQIDFCDVPLNELQKSIVHGCLNLPNAKLTSIEPEMIKTVGQAMEFLKSINPGDYKPPSEE